MEAPKRATKWVLGGGGVVGLGTVISMLWSAVENAEARANANLDRAIVQVRAEFNAPLEILAREQCRIRYRLDVQAGVPNPGGCE